MSFVLYDLYLILAISLCYLLTYTFSYSLHLVNSAMHYYVQSLHVMATCPDYEDKVSVAVLNKMDLDSAGTATVDATMPVSGVWDISGLPRWKSMDNPYRHRIRMNRVST